MPTDRPRLRILQVNTRDIDAGAARVARNLHHEYQARGHASWVAVGQKESNDPAVLDLSSKPAPVDRAAPRQAVSSAMERLQSGIPFVAKARYWLGSLADGPAAFERALGHEDFDFPRSRRLLELVPDPPDILHAHNLHGGYFDLRYLPELSHRVPTVVTLHDAWLLTGHCAHSFDCLRWKSGCGSCPDLTIYPSLPRDATAYNWRRKEQLYLQSRLYVATPCRWLMDRVEDSILLPACAGRRVIPNGVDLAIFRPGDKADARRALGLPQHAKIMLFAARGIRKSQWRDYAAMQWAIGAVAQRLSGEHVMFVALGEESPAERIGDAEIQFVPWETDDAKVALYYQAADVYVHAARVDTFPTAILEALACGVPVVATEVGGIPEQVQDGSTGFLVPPATPVALATRIEQLFLSDEMSRSMSEVASIDARTRFDYHQQVSQYLGWYNEILAGL